MMQADQHAFIRQLQAELEMLPGANVSFSLRNTEWLDRFGFLEDRESLTAEQKQAALCAAAQLHRERGDIDEQIDSVSASMFDHLDRTHPYVSEA
jgi:hypothetical protein